MKDPRKTAVEKNIDLRKKLDVLSGYTHRNTNSYLPIEIENKFFENVIAFEDAPIKPAQEVLNIKLKDFPDESTLNDIQIEKQLMLLEELLFKHNIVVDFLDRVPIRIAYQQIRKFLVEEIEIVPQVTLHLDGCSGNCEDCWQLEWCVTGKENMEEWRKEG